MCNIDKRRKEWYNIDIKTQGVRQSNRAMDKMLSTMEAQRYLMRAFGFYRSRVTINKWARQGLIGHKVNARWLFSQDELDKLVLGKPE